MKEQLMAAAWLLIPVMGLLLVLLDLTGRRNLLCLPGRVFCLLLVPNWLFLHQWWAIIAAGWQTGPLWEYSIMGLAVYLWLRLNIVPVRSRPKQTTRLEVMLGGRAITRAGLLACLLQPVAVAWGYHALGEGIGLGYKIGSAALGFGLVGLLLFHGVLRMACTARRLNVALRILMLCLWWVPVLHLPILWKACKRVWEEYDFACNKEVLRNIRAEWDICKTRYPIVMVHGVFFRDLRYFNYWGRIPKELIRYGATVYYGNQEAVGTIETNGKDIRDKILEVMRETGCDKVNIIAHSKGGLDARYMISCLDMADYVATLTTMGTPHYGCKFVDKALAIVPQTLYKALGKRVNAVFSRLGDKEPDFEQAIRQFTTQNSARFNEQVPNMSQVYYQSYATRMRGPLADTLLLVPYCIIRLLEGPNDGLVAVPSAHWGNYRGLIEPKGRRGISHGDIIDLKREDYKGFDVVETYVSLVKDLKQMGY